MRAKIRQIDTNYVQISYNDRTDSRVTREFYVPVSGGYVRETALYSNGCERENHNAQVCVGLNPIGRALEAHPDTLLDTIRAEYRRMRRWERAESKKYSLH